MPEPSLAPSNLEYVEDLYEQFVEDAARVPPEWRRWLEQWGGEGRAVAAPHHPSTRPTSIFNPPADGEADGELRILDDEKRQECIDLLIREYRVRGHLVAKVDPLGVRPGFAGSRDVDEMPIP